MSRRPRSQGRVAEVVASLEDVTTLGPGRLDADAVSDAAAMRARLDERLARGEGVTVAALAGGTGVGKSALLNALLGRSIAVEGVRRPTTSVTLAAMSAPTPEVSALLDWLEVPERREVGDALPDDLVLLDLPDHDSVVDTHRETAARLAQRVDVVVWVVDPLKYSRDDTHHGPLAAMTAHAEVLLVVLNRVDELAPDAVDACVRDLESRLVEGGHDASHVLRTSAATGEGVDVLRGRLAELAAGRTAATARLVADATVVGRRLADALDPLPELHLDADEVIDEVLEAVDAGGATAEAAGLYQQVAAARSRSVLARVVGMPLRTAARALGRVAGGPRTAPPTRGATGDGVEAALLRGLDVGRAVGGTHLALERAVRAASDRAAPLLTDAVAAAELVPRRRAWWTAMSTARLVAELTGLVGAAWLTAIAVVAWLQLPALPAPDAIGAVSWPTALLAGGVLARVLLGVLTRVARRAGARRHAHRVRRRIAAQVREVVDGHLLDPVRREVADQRRLRTAVDVLAASTE